MKPIEYKHTLALFKKIKDDLSKIAYVIRIVVQVALVFYYGFAIYRHYSSLVYLIIYCILLFISLLVFAEQLYYHNNEKEARAKGKHRKRHAALKIVGLVDKLVLLIVSFVPIAQGKASDFDKVTTLFIAILILIQRVFLSITYLRNRYREWLKEAIELDYKESLLRKSPSQTFADKIHDIARNLTGQKKASDLEEDLQGRIEESEAQKKEKKKADKQKRKERRKEDLKRIFHYYSDKRKQKKIEDDKIDSVIEKIGKKAEKILSDKDRMLEIANKAEDELSKAELSEDLSSLPDFCHFLKDDGLTLSPEATKARLINLLYFLDPILPNNETREDNRKVLEKTKSRIILPLLTQEDGKRKK